MGSIMKIEYIRNMQFGYMQIEAEVPLSRMEEEMLSHNKIEGLLPIRWQKENNRYLLRYDITGKQALDVVLEQETMDEDILRNFFVGICTVIKQMEKYLLSQNGILLQAETIFVDMKTQQIYFCYYPNEEILQKRFRQLMEYVLAKTNHRNPAAVELAYGVYEESLKDEFVLSDIKKRLEKKRELVYEEQEILEEKLIENEEENTNIEEVFSQQKKWDCFLGVWKVKCIEWINKKLKKFKKQKKQSTQIVFEPEEEEQKQGLDTIFLGEWKEEIEGILKYEGIHLLPDFSIKKTPFLIGNNEMCDGVIKLQTISHQHAKIYKIDDVYFIEDLNSTNGTMVEGEILNYKTQVSLKKNTMVCFANEPYRFL